MKPLKEIFNKKPFVLGIVLVTARGMAQTE
jgi:hypothetical protein